MSNQGNNTIIGLRYTVNNDYQKFIHDKTDNILGNQNKITVNSLKILYFHPLIVLVQLKI